MQFDAAILNELLKRDDAALWQTIRTIAAQNGIPLPEGQPSAADMARLRAILGTKGAGDVEAAAELLRRAKGGH